MQYLKEHRAVIGFGSVFFLVLFFSPFLLTRPAFKDYLDFSGSGEIGDTIGGITAPIVNFVGSVLIYISFIAQNKANKLQAQQNNYAFLHSQFDSLKEDYKELTFISETPTGVKSIVNGVNAIEYVIQNFSKLNSKPGFNQNSFFIDYSYLLGAVSLYVIRIRSAQLNEGDKKLLLMNLRLFYFAKLSIPNGEILKHIKTDQAFTTTKKTIEHFDKRIEEITEESVK